MWRVLILQRVLCMSAAAALAAGGCQSAAVRQADDAITNYYMGDPRQAEQLLLPLSKEKNENFVLNNDRLGSAALMNYDLNVAEYAFRNAYEVINSVGTNDGGRSLGAAVVSEGIKVWKGEPFERAMTNFYLGLVYYMERDYNNARACFENALFKLRDYGTGDVKNDAYRLQESNFALAYLMLGKAYLHLDQPDKARKALDRAVDLRPGLAAVADMAANQRANVLLVIDFGRGPIKVTNADGAFAGFRPTLREEGPVPLPSVVVDGNAVMSPYAIHPTVDLVALAQERVWQDIDTIRAVKDVLGTGLIAGGAGYALADRHANPYVAAGLILGGLVLKASSQADVRQWEMLPRSTFIVPLSLPPGRHDVRIDFPAVFALSQDWRGIEAPDEGEATYYFRMIRYVNGPFDWPPRAPAVAVAPGNRAP